jgi:coproporphyrinogen III oxidase
VFLNVICDEYKVPFSKLKTTVPQVYSKEQQAEAAAFFRGLRDRICTEFEKIETEGNGKTPAGQFERKNWNRINEDSTAGGGGEMSTMQGRVFEKVGVNISTVHGTFSPEFRDKIPGATDNDGKFWATGISLVAHMQSPFVPAVHMNLRMIVTTKSWLGGGTDLNPVYPDDNDTTKFHTDLKACCDRHNPTYYPEFKDWCDRYFFLPHRNEHRGVGGIFYDYINTGDFSKDFAFSKDVGETFLKTYPEIVRTHMNRDWTAENRDHQLVRRGRYVEFNLLYDRGTTFGLKTGGNIDAIFMSMPPEVKWV